LQDTHQGLFQPYVVIKATSIAFIPSDSLLLIQPRASNQASTWEAKVGAAV
jgi:hypothetical protein